ncbi:hypothetical protein ANN_05849 [Periplaneta americana]|uniref:PiggyBac transposable element-derived protein domain-containing protein n=1 Tax=Periplaneta americana TaxID=6978 RepID=A0ABQ8TEE2_PERAM|nr:hypothetical protein ANN_05849 [Periplaneta americana]
MCLVKKPSLRDYWNSEPILRTTYTKTLGMSRDRFLAIFTMLHLNDNERRVARDQPGYDPLYKIKPFLNILTTRFRDVYTPDENLTIDEAICPFRGRIFFRVYIKGKPHKYGIKIYELCEAISGYVHSLQVYAGAHETEEDYNTAFSVVNRLCEPVTNKWHTVYMDRYFTSPKLFDHLWTVETKAVGTVTANRKEMPKDIFSEKLKKGEKLTAQRDHLLAIKWQEITEVVEKLFFHLFDLALVNAHILHRKKCVKKLTLHKFIAKVAESLVTSVGMEMTIQSRLSTGGRLVGRDHFPHRIPGIGSKQKGHTQRTCKVCADRGKHHTGKATQKYTTIYCARCDVGLCIGNCFEIYHTRANYWE